MSVAASETGIPYVVWADFLARHFDWNQGEHVSLIGPTGSGKTTLALEILARRTWVTALATKPRDATMDRLIRKGWKKIQKWPPPHVPLHRRNEGQRVVLWPPFKKPEDVTNQAVQIDAAMRAMFVQGGWCIFADEARYLCVDLKLKRLLETIWTQGRSLRLSLVAGTQRPSMVPLLMYDQATHLFFWRDNDEANLKRIGGIGYQSSAGIRRAVCSLDLHEVLYVNSRTGEMLRTRIPLGR